MMGGKPRTGPRVALVLQVSQEQYNALRWLMRKRGRTEEEYLTEAIKGLVDEDCHLIAFAERMMRAKHKLSDLQFEILEHMTAWKSKICFSEGRWSLAGVRPLREKTVKVLEDHGYIAWDVAHDYWKITDEGRAAVKGRYKT